jgi:hypothetical protein
MNYYDLVFKGGAIIGQSCIVFLLVALTFDYMRTMIFYNER